MGKIQVKSNKTKATNPHKCRRRHTNIYFNVNTVYNTFSVSLAQQQQKALFSTFYGCHINLCMYMMVSGVRTE